MADQTPEDEARDREIEKEARLAQGFTLAGAIGREGGSYFAGETPIPPLQQAVAKASVFVAEHVRDLSGCLVATLQAWIARDEPRFSAMVAAPLEALAEMLRGILGDATLLTEFVRQVDVLWGQRYGERPLFQKADQPPHPDDEYTIESARRKLEELLARLEAELAGDLPIRR